jgi:hypothetical protein
VGETVVSLPSYIKAPQGHWDRIENQRHFADTHLCHKLSIREQPQWYSITQDRILECYGSGILKKYNGSPQKMLETLYPEYEWTAKPFGFNKKVPPGHWEMIENQRLFSDSYLCPKLQIIQYFQWYGLRQEDVANCSGAGLLRKYSNSLKQMIETIYPEFEWNAQYLQFQRGQWEHVENQRLFVDTHLGPKLQITQQLQWYDITKKSIQDSAGSGLLQHSYNCSPQRMLETLYPEYEWDPWQFQTVGRGHWDLIANVRRYFGSSEVDQLKKEKQMEDTVEEAGFWLNWMVATRWLRKFPSIKWRKNSISYEDEGPATLMEMVYPEFPITKNLLATLSKGELEIWSLLLEEEDQVNNWMVCYKHPTLLHSLSGKNMEFDFFNIKQQLAIEYQGMQHYQPMLYRSDPTKELHDQQIRDKEKREACLKAKISLIEIDCRVWDNIPISRRRHLLREAIVQRKSIYHK